MRGFTLIEVMVAILISALIFVGILSVLTIGKNSWYIGTTHLDVQQEVRTAMDAMIKELRGASAVDSSTFTAGVSSNFIRFTLKTETIEFAVSSGQLQRTASGTTTVLANNIDNVEFKIMGADAIHITLHAEKTSIFGYLVETTLRSKVVLRN